jgi:2-dehydro-3-deoxygluconokinase
MKKIVTLGEVMLRLSPPGNERFFQTDSYDVEFGGSEANVGAALAFWGNEVYHLTAFPDQEIGWAASARLRRNLVKTDFVKFYPGRMGIYFLEQGAMQRSSQVIYDRADSVFAKFDGSDLNWDLIFEGADWLHWSGISPAISQEAANLTLKALQEANDRGIMVSGDLNYRSNLWQYGKKPNEVMPELMLLTHVMIAGKRDFSACLNIEFEDFERAKGHMFNHFPKLKYISKTERHSHSSSHNGLVGDLISVDDWFTSKSYDLTHIVDRVGTGDAYAGGLIQGLLYLQPQEAIDFAVAAGAIKHSVPGDVLLCSMSEVHELVVGEAIGKIKR